MSEVELLKDYIVEKPEPLIGAKTVQLLVIREMLDFTVLRTEDTRELNTVTTPKSVSNNEPTRRVAFLATKQKAAESRELEHLLRTATAKAGMSPKECYLKDNLCMECPRCAIYGATSTVSGREERANIKHRIEYSTAFSLLPFEEVNAALTFNAVNDKDITTGQALGTRYAVLPATLFPSIITLKSVTRGELILVVKTLLSTKSYGAESRIGGDVRNTIVGVIGGWEEIITAMEFSLELFDLQEKLTPEEIEKMVKSKYLPLAGNPDRVKVFSTGEVEQIVKACSDQPLDSTFLKKAYDDVTAFRKAQTSK